MGTLLFVALIGLAASASITTYGEERRLFDKVGSYHDQDGPVGWNHPSTIRGGDAIESKSALDLNLPEPKHAFLPAPTAADRVLLVSNRFVEMMYAVGQHECWTKMARSCSLDVQGVRSLTQTVGETMEAVVQVAQRPGDTLEELSHEPQSLHFAHFVAGG
jgi:hypothetical protein